MILQRINIYKYEIRYKNSKMKLNTIGILQDSCVWHSIVHIQRIHVSKNSYTINI